MGFLQGSLLVVAVWSLSSTAFAQRTIYCCDDDQGRPICGDLLPSACFGRAYREISPQGLVRRHVAAPLTAEEIARRDAEERRRKEEEARLAVQRRLDEALLETYMSLDDIDVREERALAEVERTVVDVRQREQDLIERREELRREVEFYRDRDVPRELASEIRLIETELTAYQNVIAAKEAEKDAIRTRFASDRRRYAELLATGQGRR